MIFAALALYFLIAVAVIALALFKPARSALFSSLSNISSYCQDKSRFILKSASGEIRRSGASAIVNAGELQNLLVRRRLLLLGTTGILLTPPLIAIALHGKRFFQFNYTPEPDEKIAALLNGEQLVAPPPLPPDVFTTHEVEQIRPSLKDASRDWNLLDVDFRTRLLLVYKIMHEQYGYDLVLLEGYRSPERQDALSKLGGNVTNAAAYQSYHQYGLAADNAFLRDGKIVITEKDPWAMKGYQLYGQVAEQVGLHWGGHWKNMDLGHVEYHKPGFVMSHAN